MVCANANANLMTWPMDLFTCEEADVSWRSCSHV